MKQILGIRERKKGSKRVLKKRRRKKKKEDKIGSVRPYVEAKDGEKMEEKVDVL